MKSDECRELVRGNLYKPLLYCDPYVRHIHDPKNATLIKVENQSKKKCEKTADLILRAVNGTGTLLEGDGGNPPQADGAPEED